MESADNPGPRRCCKGLFSSNVKTEICCILKLAWPTVLSYFCELLLPLQSILFCGSLGKTELAAGSLSISIFNIFGLSFAIGLTSALNTLCAQACGAKNFKMIGMVLQRGVCILSVAMIIVCAVWMLTQHFLLLIGMESELAKMSDRFMMILLPILPACFGTQLLTKFLQTQGIVMAPLVIGLITNVVALGLNFLIVKQLHQGFDGVAIALIITLYVQLILSIMYIILWNVCKETWKGWSIECLYDWKEFVGLSIPGMLMVCLEWWTFEISSFFMGRFGQTTVAANGVLIQISSTSFMIPLGISVAAGVLVANHLGANNPTRAKLATRLSLILNFITSMVIATTLLTSKQYIPLAFSKNKEVIKLIASTTPYLALFCFLDSFQGLCSGIIRGCGRQKLGMIITFISYDVVAIPMALILAFVADMRLKGMWLGISSGVAAQAFQYLIVLLCTNWNRQAELAVERTRDEQHLDHQEDQETIPLILNIKEQDRKVSISATNADTETLQHINPDVPIEPGGSATRRHVLNKKKLICLRSIPYIIAFLVLCSTLCVRLFVPLPGDGNYGNHTSQN